MHEPVLELELHHEPERAKPGIHFKEIEHHTLSMSCVNEVLRGAQTAGMLGFLKDHPIEKVDFVPDLKILETFSNGAYVPALKTIRIHASRPEDSYGEAFVPGESYSISTCGGDHNEAMKRTLVHELGHHILNVGGDEVEGMVKDAWLKRRPITEYAGDNWREYFCESHAAYAFHRRSLKNFDEVGYNMVEQVRQMLRMDG